MSERIWTDDMGEISGFGGGYEACCRAMVFAGMDWCDAHPDADPKFHGWKNIYGIIEEDNEDAKALTAAVLAPGEAGGGATGAMHQAAISHVLYYRAHGWDKYASELRAREQREQSEAAP